MAEAANTSPSASTLYSLMKWIGGIAAPVIVAVVVYWILPHPNSQPRTPGLEFYGVVADAASHTLIANALVVVALDKDSVSQKTDSLGQYNVALESAVAGPVMGSVNIAASGYKTYSNSVKLHPGTNFAEITLQSDMPPPVPHPGQQAGAAAPAPAQLAPSSHAAITFRAPPQDFIRRQSMAILHAK